MAKLKWKSFFCLAGIPRKKLKSNNGLACAQQPKNTVAMLNELRQGLVYHLEGQSGPVHAPIFTMTVEVIHQIFRKKNIVQTIKRATCGFHVFILVFVVVSISCFVSGAKGRW